MVELIVLLILLWLVIGAYVIFRSLGKYKHGEKEPLWERVAIAPWLLIVGLIGRIFDR